MKFTQNHKTNKKTNTENKMNDNNIASTPEDALQEWKRKREERERERQKRLLSSSNNNNRQHHAEQQENQEELDDTVEFLPAKKRRNEAIELIEQLNTRKRRKIHEDDMEDEHSYVQQSDGRDSTSSSSAVKTIEAGPLAKMSLLEQAKEIAKSKPKLTEVEKEQQKEQELMEVISQMAPLMKAPGVGSGTAESEDDAFGGSMKSLLQVKTGWKPPKFISDLTEDQCNQIRQKFHIIVEGENMPPPVTRFIDLRLPQPILDHLADKKIQRPTPIQMQALPAILSGRDLIGIAFTGSGKTLVFSLPMIMFALGEELKLQKRGSQSDKYSRNGDGNNRRRYYEDDRRRYREESSDVRGSTGPGLRRGEGPIGLILCPNRELAKQTFDIIQEFTSRLRQNGFPQLNCMLCTGGLNMRDQQQQNGYDSGGTHMVVATPGRLLHMLNEKKLNFRMCRYICLDEADRLIDYGFEEDVRNIFAHFNSRGAAAVPRQTVLFSATMPEKIQKFAKSSLSNPLVVNVGRAGAASLNVVQEVEFVKQEAKMVYLLQVLQKTPPPVLVFCENKSDVDEIHEYLMLKGVEVVSIHAGKTQQEREEAIRSFKSEQRDVLVATDIVSKGLDFPDIKHVINYDMPKHIEDYVHRIGRTGRGEKTGLATTFINFNDQESVLLDLKHLLVEAKQRVPKIIQGLQDPFAQLLKDSANDDASAGGSGAVIPCKYCGGLGHRITNCPKLEKDRNDRLKKAKGINESLGGGDY